MKYPAYPKYKDSGVEWLGEVPEHWEVGKLGFEASVKARLGWKGLKAEEYVDEGYVFLSTPNIKDNCIDFDNVNYITEERYFESPEIMICQGDVLIAKDGSTTGITNVVRHLPSPATVNSSLAVLRPKGGTDSVYLYYWMLSSFTQFVIKKMQGGMGVPHLFQADLKKFSLLLPSLPEQRAIAAFLDAHTSKLDALIAKERELIDKLKEKRAALITRTVTRGLPPDAATAAGLDPYPKMKDSGVEWLGEVPEPWAVKRLKHYIQRLNSGASVNSDNMPTEDDSPGILKTSCVYGDVFRPEENKLVVEEEINRVFCPVLGDSLIISRMNTPELVGSCGYVAQGLPHLYLPDRLWITHFANKNKSFPKFFWYRIISRDIKEQISSLATGTSGSMKNLMQESFLSIAMAIPPLAEQRAIAAYLDRETAAIDALVAKVETAIERLQEYRAALINTAVTGQIDVREAVQ